MFDHPRDMTLLYGGQSGDAARQDFAGIRHMAGQLLDVQMRQIHWIFVAYFLRHKREKTVDAGRLDKKKVGNLE